jgi:hypothetical protein
VPVEVDDPDVALYVGRDTTHVRVAYRVVTAQDHRATFFSATCLTTREIWSKVISMLAGMKKTSPI